MSFTSDLVNQSMDPSSTGLHVAINQLISHFNSFYLYMHTTLAIIRMQSFCFNSYHLLAKRQRAYQGLLEGNMGRLLQDWI